MSRDHHAADYDPLLMPLLGARDERERDQVIERLLAAAQPLIERILARHFRSDPLAGRNSEDVAATIQLRLLGKLRKLAAGETGAIRRFDDYVATLAYNALNDHLRERYPRLTALKNQVRYLLTHDRRFALWPHGGDDLASGLAEWRETRVGVLREPPALSPTAPLLARDRADALAAVFRTVGAPLLLHALIRLLAQLWRVSDAVHDILPEPPAARDPSPSAQLETRESLHALWAEIEALGPRHRKALLLNLRDDQTVNVISVFVFAGIATFDRIAAALEMDGEALAAIWNDLPLDDLRIASLLGLTRQQVINLRKSARNRLQRKLSPRGGTGKP
jgi:RNA polymerase sigma factor (sigma-70 family)